jgi:hypothetical protein
MQDVTHFPLEHEQHHHPEGIGSNGSAVPPGIQAKRARNQRGKRQRDHIWGEMVGHGGSLVLGNLSSEL